jgi:hypothetical protein
VWITPHACGGVDGGPGDLERLAVAKHIVDQDNTLPDSASVEIELAGNTVTVLR